MGEQRRSEWRGRSRRPARRQRGSGVGASSSQRTLFTIFVDLLLVGATDPQTDCLTWAGAYSAHATPTDDAATSTAPRACPTESAMRASAPTNDSSSATASGACRAISSWTPVKMVRRRASGGAPLRTFATTRGTWPWRRPPLSWTIPYPHAAVPGSMPRTFTETR